MELFLREVASSLYSKYGDEISNLCIVFPGRRAALFFNKYLSEYLDKPLWAPSVFTINELMQHLSSSINLADDITLIFELYKIYRREKKTEESFDSFYFWGEMLLRDFDEIDKYTVPASDLFKNLASIK
jgi:hypothetical protein